MRVSPEFLTIAMTQFLSELYLPAVVVFNLFVRAPLLVEHKLVG